MIPKRPYGRSRREISVVGFGGLMAAKMPQPQADDLVREALKMGVNYFDVAPTYSNAEEVLGPALKGVRDGVFLACKTLERTRDKAAAELRRSLKRLHTDHFDLYQLHALSSLDDVQQVFAPGGALEAFLEARDKGLIRHIGFSAHSAAAALAAMDRFAFDSVLFPLNYLLFSKESFGPQVVAKAKEKGITLLALKALAKSALPKGAPREFAKCWYRPITDRRHAALSLRFTLSQSVTAAVSPGEEQLFRQAVELAQNVAPLSDEETRELEQFARDDVPFFRREG